MIRNKFAGVRRLSDSISAVVGRRFLKIRDGSTLCLPDKGVNNNKTKQEIPMTESVETFEDLPAGQTGFDQKPTNNPTQEYKL